MSELPVRRTRSVNTERSHVKTAPRQLHPIKTELSDQMLLTNTQACHTEQQPSNKDLNPKMTGELDAVPRYMLHQGDAISWLNSLNEESVDLIITDPPYESLEKHRAVGTTTRLKKSRASSNEWFSIFPNSRFPELVAAVWRVLKRNSHFYLFCDAETMFVIKPLAEAAGFKFWKPLVWDKKLLGMGYHYRARYEFILFFEKGKRRLVSLSIPDIFEVRKISRGYPTEKPVEVSRILIGQSTQVGDLVIDPFAGSGSVGVAALELERRFWGNDSSETSLEMAQRRLEALTV